MPSNGGRGVNTSMSWGRRRRIQGETRLLLERKMASAQGRDASIPPNSTGSCEDPKEKGRNRYLGLEGEKKELT